MEPTSISLIANLPFEVAQSCIELLVSDAVLDPALCLGDPLGAKAAATTVHKQRTSDEMIKKQQRCVTLTSHKPPPTLHILTQRDFSEPPVSSPSLSIATPVPLTESSMQGSGSLERFRECARGPEGGEGGAVL